VRARTGAVVVCSLQDEAPWIDAMGSPWSERVWTAIRGLSAHVDAFISVSEHYAGVVLERTGIARERVSVVPIGVDPADYPAASPDPAAPVIGYMARMSEAGGLGDLVEAFVRLKRQPGRAALRLAVTGGLTHDDDGFLAGVRELLAREGMARDVEFIDDFGFERRRRFLQSLTLFSVPGTAQTAFGLFVLEALASGVPAVQPAAGAFPEMLGATGGGVLYDPGDPGALAGALASLLDDPARARELGRRAREGVARHYAVAAMAGRYLDLYRAARGSRGG
jgi:glycosyltransferase involved in cell wall biosynthesis